MIDGSLGVCRALPVEKVVVAGSYASLKLQGTDCCATHQSCPCDVERGRARCPGRRAASAVPQAEAGRRQSDRCQGRAIMTQVYLFEISKLRQSIQPTIKAGQAESLPCVQSGCSVQRARCAAARAGLLVISSQPVEVRLFYNNERTGAKLFIELHAHIDA